MAIKQNPRVAQGARAAVSLAVGLFLTFSQSHGAEIGLLALGIFGLGFALLNGLASVLFQKGLAAIENVPLTMVALLIGIFALMAPNTISGAIDVSATAAASDALAFNVTSRSSVGLHFTVARPSSSCPRGTSRSPAGIGCRVTAFPIATSRVV